MQLFHNWANILETAAIQLLLMFPLIWLLERFSERGSVSTASQFRAIRYLTVQLAATALVVLARDALFSSLHIKPIFVVPLRGLFSAPAVHWLAAIAIPVIVLIIYDFFTYWMHRAQHRFFWRQHSIHHSITEMSGINAYFHWTEEIFRMVFATLPVALLFDFDTGPEVLMVVMLRAFQGYYIHSSTGLSVGPLLRRVIVDNRFHRIHHSTQIEHFDKNFGAATSLWDIVFGTAYFPQHDEWPDTGIEGTPEPASIGEYVLRPLIPAAWNLRLFHRKDAGTSDTPALDVGRKFQRGALS